MHVYDVSNATKKLVFTSNQNMEELRYVLAHSEAVLISCRTHPMGQPITFEVDARVCGDVLVEIDHVTSFYRCAHPQLRG